MLQNAVIKQAEATIQATAADLWRCRLEAERQQKLLVGDLAGTRQLTEQAIDNRQRAEATLAVNRAQLDQQRQQLSVLDSQERQARATLDAQQAARDLAVQSQANVLAYIDGFIILGFAVIGGLLVLPLLRTPPAPQQPEYTSAARV